MHDNSYNDLAQGTYFTRSDLFSLADEISTLAAVRDGHAVLIGSIAWGMAGIGSDIDIVTYDCDATKTLEADIGAITSRYQCQKAFCIRFPK